MIPTTIPATAGNVVLPRRVRSSEPIANQPASPHQVPPSLRFMLTPEALQEAEMFRLYLYEIGWEIIQNEHRAALVEKIVALMPERYPNVARADKAIDGMLVEALRAFGRTPDMPGWWRTILWSMSGGHPETLRGYCKFVIAAGRPKVSADDCPF
jgi:hypothetical protein